MALGSMIRDSYLSYLAFARAFGGFSGLEVRKTARLFRPQGRCQIAWKQ